MQGNISSKQKEQMNVDQLIKQFTEFGKGEIQTVNYSYLSQICDKVKKVLNQQSYLLQIFAPIKVVGSIYGHLKGLIDIFDFVGHPSNMSYIFLGNYVDEGPNSLQTILLLFLFKIKYPNNFFLLRGRHQFSHMNLLYGFYNECKNKIDESSWKKITQIYNHLPYAAVVDQKIFVVNGGIGPQLEDLKQIQRLQKGVENYIEGLACDLIWSDPDRTGYGFEKNIQGISYYYGRDCVQRFLIITGIQMIIRTHQPLAQGFEFMFQKKLINVFSAPNFQGYYNNNAAIISICNDLKVQLQIYIPKKNQVPITNLLLH